MYKKLQRENKKAKKKYQVDGKQKTDREELENKKQRREKQKRKDKKGKANNTGKKERKQVMTIVYKRKKKQGAESSLAGRPHLKQQMMRNTTRGTLAIT